ncbi:MAG: hypothetical protein IJR15_08480 [Clostridiales bacterium]|nr:hypothetical protein [Clostridiales bacterium]
MSENEQVNIEQPTKVKKNIFKKIWSGIKKPFGFIKRKSKPAREFMKSGRAGGMILELLLASQFCWWIIDSYTYNKYNAVLIFFISMAFVAIITELCTLILKLLFAGGKRCRGYFIAAFTFVAFTNIAANQLEAVPGALLFSYALALAVDVSGRIIWGFIKTKRFKQVFAYIALALCAAVIGGYAYTYHNDIFGDSRVEFYTSFAPEIQTAQAQGFDAYMQDGPYTVAELSYGPEDDNDIVTDTLDFTIFDQTEAEGLDAITDIFDDYDFTATPVKGQIWYPQGQTNCPVFFIVHGNHDSYVPSYLGYDYLGQSLASHGYVVISVDENIINATGVGNDLRAILLLENMKVIFELNDTEGSAIAGLIDEDTVAIGGHSRGGEMVATAYLFNELDYYPEDGNVTFDYHFNITSIVAIAPVVDQYRPVSHSVEISDVNYLLIHGSNDQDVSSMMGEKQYNNITFTGETDEFYMKSEVYILGANHGQFNTQWGRYDTPGAPAGYLNTHNFLDPEDQQFIASSYIRVFLDTTLGIDNTYEELLSNIDAFRSYLPDTVYITNYEDSNFEQLITFDDTVDIGIDQSVTVSGADTWTIISYDRGYLDECENYVLSVEWEEESAPEITMNFDAVDISSGYISFALADMNETEVEDIEEGFHYTVTLTDINGNTVTVDDPTFIYHTLAVQLWKDDVFFGSYEYKHQMQRVLITPEAFEQAGDFDFSAVTGMTVTTDGTEAGALIIDNLGYNEGAL